ncbi:MAG: hypothetical protein IJU44_06945 [Kiritimatiellae bacterium]|nr:hypothetical protein [Kiritimatiellia bacterium]
MNRHRLSVLISFVVFAEIALTVAMVANESILNNGITVVVNDARIIYSSVSKNGGVNSMPDSFVDSSNYVCCLLATNSNFERCDYWCFATHVPDNANDNFPVMFTSNINPALLLQFWDGTTDGEKIIPLGKSSGALSLPLLKDRAAIIIRKTGAIQVIKAKNLSLKTLYNRAPFHLDNEIEYLTPKGRVRGRKTLWKEQAAQNMVCPFDSLTVDLAASRTS